ncbi:MAG TPA: hypothetical protein VK158_04620 [Acidobacteriota bacterium]|nr:hypothetical protein [Acidobacteriota bacterium]
MASAFGNALQFLAAIGIYDVVLPFLLTFVIVFAILEKTRILGEDVVGKEKYTKKNLNALVGFCVGFFVVASTSIVAIINQTLAQIVLLFIMSVFYMALIGIFNKNDQATELPSSWKKGMMWTMLVVLLFIFANAIKLRNGQSVLDFIYSQVIGNYNSAVVSSLLLMAVIILVIYFLVRDPHAKERAGAGGGSPPGHS